MGNKLGIDSDSKLIDNKEFPEESKQKLTSSNFSSTEKVNTFSKLNFR